MRSDTALVGAAALIAILLAVMMHGRIANLERKLVEENERGRVVRSVASMLCTEFGTYRALGQLHREQIDTLIEFMSVVAGGQAEIESLESTQHEVARVWQSQRSWNDFCGQLRD
jgi:hypothetical protein